jgi:prepilin peptidase CpaA
MQIAPMPASLLHDWLSAPAFLASLAPMFALLGIAAILDWRWRMIPNWLSFSLLAAGLLRGVLGPWLGLGEFGPGQAVLGALTGFALGVPLFAIGARGAGDAKLYIACGAWLGWSGIIAVFMLEAIVGLVMVIIQCTIRGKLVDLLRNTGVLLMSVLMIRRIGVEQARENATQFTSIDRRLPHAVPFLAAAVLAIAIVVM